MADKLTWYTIISAFWLAFLAILGVNIIGGLIMPEHATVEKFGYPVEVPETAVAAAPGAGADTQRPNIVPLIAAASMDNGNAQFRKCAACHSVAPNASPMAGPNLHNVVGRAVASAPGFTIYSDSLKAVGGEWSYEKLDDYLDNPKRLAPRGTMSFAGLKKPEDRAAVIKFLMANTENAPPLPAAEAPAQAPAAPAAN